MSREKTVSITYVQKVLDVMEEHLAVDESDIYCLAEMKTLMRPKLREFYQSEPLKKIIKIANILDPRNKFPKYHTDEIKTLLVKEITNIVIQNDSLSQELYASTEGQEQHNINKLFSPISSSSCSKSPVSKPYQPNKQHSKKENSTSTVMRELYCGGKTDKVDRANARSNTNEDLIKQKIENEVILYLQQQRLELDDDENDFFNVLEYWKKMQQVFPYLCLLVKSYLCIPATSCTSERAFSVANNIITKSRNKLSPDTAKTLLKVKYNIKLLPNDTPEQLECQNHESEDFENQEFENEYLDSSYNLSQELNNSSLLNSTNASSV